MKNAKFWVKKLDMTCFYCDGKSEGVLVFLNGDEVACCKECAKKNTQRTTRKIANASSYPLMRSDTKNFSGEYKGKLDKKGIKTEGSEK